MGSFTEDYPQAKRLLLTENYRSGRNIVELADAVIRRNPDRFEKAPVPVKSGGTIRFCFLDSRKEEERRLLQDIAGLSEKQRQKSAVIVRTNAEAYRYAIWLKQNGIPVRERQKRNDNIWNHDIAEDFKAFLQFIREGNRRRDFLRIMNKPNLFLTRQALPEEVVKRESFLEYYRNNEEMRFKVTAFFDHLENASHLSPVLAIRYFRKVMGYDGYLQSRGKPEEGQLLMQIADKLQEQIKGMRGDEKTEAFFGRMTSSEGEKEKTEEGIAEGISVITMHGAKGLEFEAVFLPDLNEGVIPGRNCREKEELEEERRLLYVAITRAVTFLYLYATKERNRKLTRFLEGLIPPQHQ
jgi:DNA helicase-2/ATP-dependent DNA helicase PcrA